MLRKITQSPYLNLISGLILLLSSAYEIITTIDETSFAVRHGILIFSIIQIVKVIPEILHGLTEIEEAEEIVQKKLAD